MTIVQTKNAQNSSGEIRCPSCNTLLPSYARFCGVCGKRVVSYNQQMLNDQIRDDLTNEDTIQMVALTLQDAARWRATHPKRPVQDSNESQVPPTAPSWLRRISLIAKGETGKIQASPTHPVERDQTQHPTTEKSTITNGLKSNILFKQSPVQFVLSLSQRVHANSLLRNGIFIMGTGAATAIFGYLFWVLAAHTYSAYDVGLASALISAMTLASTIANLGIGSTLIQTLPQRESGHDWSLTLNAGLTIGILAGLLAGVVVVVVLPLLSPQFIIVEQQASYAFILLVGVPIVTLSTLLDQAFVAERASINMLIRNLAVAILKIPLMVLPVILLGHVGALPILASGIIAMLVMLGIGMLLLLPRLRRSYCLAVRGIVKQIRSMLSSLAGHYFINLGGLTSQYLLPVFVAIQLSPTENAYFYTTGKVTDFFFMVSSAIAVSLFAEGSHAANTLSQKVRSSIVIIGSVLVPSMILCFFGGKYIMSIFGPSYAENGQELFKIYAISAIPDATTSIYISVLRVQRRLRFAAVLNIGMAVITLGLAWIFLPLFGINGAGWAFLISQSAGTLVAGIDLLRLRYIRRVSNNTTNQNEPDRAEAEGTYQEAVKLN
jgi:O-antigen/teichoic acid export membrane protein